MISVKALMGSFFLLLAANINASEFLCPVPTNFQNLSCEGSIEVSNLSDLISYKSTLAQKKGKAKNLIINFDVKTNALTISTPCKITLAERRSLTINGALCLHADQGIDLNQSIHLQANNVRLESRNNVLIEDHADIKADNLELLSLGNTDDSRAHIRASANVDVANLSLEAFNRVSLGSNSTYKVAEDLKLYSRGDDDASIGADTKVTATIFELQAYDQAKLSNNVSIKADTVIINAKACAISNKTTIITATDKLGSCFLQSSPKGLFTVDKNSGFAPLVINFSATKISSTSFIWNFGNGETQTTSSPKVIYTYNRIGSFTATLKYLEGKKYKNAGAIQITVKEHAALPPVASLICTTNNLLVGCNAIGSYDPQSGPLIFNFNFADGFSETNSTGLSTHAYTQAGLYLVKLTVSNLAGLTAVSTAQVLPMLPPNQLPVLKLNCTSPKPNSLDCDSAGSIDTDGTIISYQYSFDDLSSEIRGDTNKVSHSFSNGGTHSVKLIGTDNDGGVTTLTQSFSVIQNTNPIANFNCSSDRPYQVTCQSTSTDSDFPNDAFTEYSWKINNQIISSSTNSNLSYNFNSGGDFNISLSVKDSYGGKGTVSKTITVKENIAPIASFTCKNIGVQSLHCDSTSSDSDGQIITTAWILDDGTNLSGQSFDHTFTSGGSHVVTLLVVDDLGGSSTKKNSFQTIPNQAPTVDLFASTLSGSIPLAVNFEAQNATDSDGSIAKIEWFFSDGSNAVGANATHTFNTIGVFSANLKVTDNFGAVTTKIVTINALEPLKTPPFAYFQYFQSNTSVDLFHMAERTQFDFDHAFYTIDKTKNIPVTDFYASNYATVDLESYGHHEITFTIVDVRGQTASYTQSFELSENFEFIRSIPEFTAKQSAVRTIFINTNYAFYPDYYDDIDSLVIDYGDGSTEQLHYNLNKINLNQYATHKYDQAGTYTVKLTSVTYEGKQDFLSKEISITNDETPILNPYASFFTRQFGWANNVIFNTDLSGTPNGKIISYLWDFGDGSNDTGEMNYHFYDNPGDYIIKLTVTDSLGAKNTQLQKITVSEAGPDFEINLDADNDKDPDLHISTAAFDKLNDINSVKINWGDGVVSDLLGTLKLPNMGRFLANHVYKNPGIYTIELIVGTTRGEVQTKTIDREIVFPVAQIGCITNNMLVSCNSAGSYDPQGRSLSFKFEYGDGYIEENASGFSTHAYSLAGLSTVTLTVTNDHGDQGIASMQVMPLMPPNELPIVAFHCDSYSPLTISCWDDGIRDSDGSVVIRKLSFDDNGSDFLNSQPESTSHLFANGGEHTVTLTVIDNDGGVSTLSKIIEVKENHNPVADFDCYAQGPQRMSCYSISSDPDNGDRPVTFDWDFGDGNFQSGLAGWFDHTYGTSPIYTVKLTAHDQFGGSATLEKEITMVVNQSPIASIECHPTNGSSYSCNADAHDPDGNIVEKYWTIEGSKINDFNILYSFTNGGDYPVTFTMVDDLGKKEVIVINVNIDKPIAILTCANLTNYKIRCEATTSTNTTNGKNLNYTIFFGDNFLVNAPTGEFEFQTSGEKRIRLIVTDVVGNKSQIEKIIKIRPKYSLPSPVFVEVIELGGEVLFDASLSLNQDRIVVKYEWDYGDGEKNVSSDPKVTHIFHDNLYYNVSLKITDSIGTQATFLKTIFLQDPQVQDPGEPGRNDLLGIDSDSDGIRDDVQRWIQLVSKDDMVFKKYLRSLALVYEENFKNLNSLANIRNNFIKQNKLEQCLKLPEPDLIKVDQLISLFRIAYGNTDERFLALNTIDASFAGSKIDPDMLKIDLTIFCEALP